MATRFIETTFVFEGGADAGGGDLAGRACCWGREAE